MKSTTKIRSNGAISSYVGRAIKKLELSPGSLVLDIPCGYGRHSRWLSERGHTVIAADVDLSRLDYLHDAIERFDYGIGKVCCVAADADDELPFPKYAFDLALIVDYVSGPLLAQIHSAIKPGGFLVFETYGNRGQNWRTLPYPGDTRSQLNSAFEMLDYQERSVGPTRTEAAVVKLTARRRTSV